MQPRQRLPNTIGCGTEETFELPRERRMQWIRSLCRTFLIVLHFAMKMVLNFDVLRFMTFLRTFLVMFVFRMDFDRCRQRGDSQNGRKIIRRWNSVGNFFWTFWAIINPFQLKWKIDALYYLEISFTFPSFFSLLHELGKCSHRGRAHIHIYTKSNKNFFCLRSI